MKSLRDYGIGKNMPTFFIAEIGSNFDGDINRAKELISIAKESGANAVKFQHYTADTLVSAKGFEILNINSHQTKWESSVFDTYKKASLNVDWTEELKNYADKEGIIFFTSPYSNKFIPLLNNLVPFYKIGSGDITWIDFVKYVSSQNKPIMLATGASDMDDVIRAMDIILSQTSEVVLMQCNTNYTVDLNNYSHINLNVLNTFRDHFPDVILGLSDHTPGHLTVLGAVTLGARVIEKHFTDSNKRKGPDHLFAMNPTTWKEMVDMVRNLELCLGDGHKRVESNEFETKILQRRSVRIVRDVKKGDILNFSDIEFLRPCPLDAIQPYEINKYLGQVFSKSLSIGDYLRHEDFLN